MAEVWRIWRRAPWFATTVFVLVAAVVAVNATAFSAIHALRWKALPYAQADQLVDLRANLSNFGFVVGLAEHVRKELAADTTNFVGALGFIVPSQPRLDDGGRPWRVARVTVDFERVLGVAPILGRSFSLEDGETATLVLSEATWRTRFDADPGIIGRQIRFVEASFTVIGVMPAGFVFPERSIDAWRPLVISASERELVNIPTSLGDLDVVVRVTEGVSVEQARARVDAIMAGKTTLAGLIAQAGVTAQARSWRDRFADGHEQALALLQLAALILLIVVLAILVNLTLDRLLARVRELAIRRALGASEREILSSVLADLLPPIVIGGLFGLALTPFGLALAQRHGLLPDALPQGADFGFFSLFAGAVVTCFVFAISAVAVVLARRRAGLSSRAGVSGLGRARPVMLVAQVMLTTTMLGCAGLLLRSAINLASVDRGFDDRGVVLTAVDPVGVSISGKSFDPEADSPRLTTLVERIRADVARLPGVSHAAISQAPPFSGTEEVSTLRVPGMTETLQGRSRQVGPGYFAALGIGLTAGREFEAADLSGDGAVIVDEIYRRRHLADADPLGAYVEIPTDREGNFRKAPIVGVARTVRHERLDEADNLATIYEITRAPLPIFWLVTRTRGDPAVLAQSVRERVLKLAPDADFGVNAPLSSLVAASLAERRSLLGALGGFAAATLLLAGVGLAAVLSFAIRRRTAEIGVRMAIGATPRRIVQMILREGGLLIATGAALGIITGVPLARVLSARLYGIASSDAITWLGALIVVTAVALFACWWPARRAAQTDPMVALRSD
ncbi:MAG: FtsX-like permease family protein [Dokdonella sp.]